MHSSSRFALQVTAEARARLVAGLKRYFHAKRSEGLLSMEGLRILDYACDVAADRALDPLVSHLVSALRLAVRRCGHGWPEGTGLRL